MVGVFLSFVSPCVDIFFMLPQERHWESAWTIDALWEVVYLALLVAVCFLLRPSMNAQRCEGASEGGGRLLRCCQLPGASDRSCHLTVEVMLL